MVKNGQVAFWVTVFCFILAYPISHLLATLPMKYSNLLMICVLLPFWTSLLVRTSSWMVLLQQQGPINDLIVWLGWAANDNRPELMYNTIGTFVAMTQILLPLYGSTSLQRNEDNISKPNESWKVFRWNAIYSI